MLEVIKAPGADEVPRLARQKWVPAPANDTAVGLGQVVVFNGGPRRVMDETPIIFHRMLVRSGQRVEDGQPVAELFIGGSVQIIRSHLNGCVIGIVEREEGQQIEPDANLLFILSTVDDRKSAKLQPRSSGALRRRYLASFETVLAS